MNKIEKEKSEWRENWRKEKNKKTTIISRRRDGVKIRILSFPLFLFLSIHLSTLSWNLFQNPPKSLKIRLNLVSEDILLLQLYQNSVLESLQPQFLVRDGILYHVFSSSRDLTKRSWINYFFPSFLFIYFFIIPTKPKLPLFQNFPVSWQIFTTQRYATLGDDIKTILPK